MVLIDYLRLNFSRYTFDSAVIFYNSFIDHSLRSTALLHKLECQQKMRLNQTPFQVSTKFFSFFTCAPNSFFVLFQKINIKSHTSRKESFADFYPSNFNFYCEIIIFYFICERPTR